MTVLSRPAMNEVYLVVISYIVLVTFLAMEVCLSVWAGGRRPLCGTAASLAFTYLTYCLLPIRLREALFAGLVLSAVQLNCLLYWTDPNDWLWTQVR